MTCNFRVGQKVVCVDDGALWDIKTGSVYTVAQITVEPDVYVDIETGDFSHIGANQAVVYLTEVVLRHTRHGVRTIHFGGFSASRFRPVVQRKTDISIFKALLTPSKEKVEAAS